MPPWAYAYRYIALVSVRVRIYLGHGRLLGQFDRCRHAMASMSNAVLSHFHYNIIHSNSDITCSVHVCHSTHTPLSALPCNVMFVQVGLYILWMAMVYTVCHSYIPCTASTVTCTCNLSEYIHHSKLWQRIERQCTTTPLSEYPCTPQ